MKTTGFFRNMVAIFLVVVGIHLYRAQAEVTFSDGTFNNGDWSLTVISQNASASASQQTSGGNPGSFRLVTLTENGSGFSSVYAYNISAVATYEPRNGAISNIDWSEHTRLIVGFGNGELTHAALMQNGKFYYAGGGSSPSFNWTVRSAVGLTASQFVNISDSSHPDFSTNGAPISFGFMQNDNNGGSGAYTLQQGIDNWSVVLHVQCPVGSLTTPHSNEPAYNESLLAPNLQTSLPSFRNAVQALGGTVTPTSGYRSPAYQAHLFEIRTKFLQLKAIDGVNALVVSGRPHLATTPTTAACQNVVDAVNNEITQHQLVARQDGTPPVNEHSLHEQGMAVDLNVSGLPTDVSLDELARQNGLYRPNPAGDRVHFQPINQTPQRDVTVTGRSPINIFVEDPLGRKIGFNSASNAVVNEIGADATYSGPGTEPQIIRIRPNAVVSGSYKASGIGTGSGGYTIDVQINSEDDDGFVDVLTKILAVGTASAGQQLAAIPPIDCVRSTALLQAERIGPNLRLFAPPWATNVVAQFSSNLLSGAWVDIPQPVNATNGLTVSNLSSGVNFFRLKLP